MGYFPKISVSLLSKSDKDKPKNAFFYNGVVSTELFIKVNEVSNKPAEDTYVFGMLNDSSQELSFKEDSILSELSKFHKKNQGQNEDAESKLQKLNSFVSKLGNYENKAFSGVVVQNNNIGVVSFGKSAVYLIRNKQIKHVIAHFNKIERYLNIGLINDSQIQEIIHDDDKNSDKKIQMSDIIEVADNDLYVICNNDYINIFEDKIFQAEISESSSESDLMEIVQKWSSKIEMSKDSSIMTMKMGKISADPKKTGNNKNTLIFAVVIPIVASGLAIATYFMMGKGTDRRNNISIVSPSPTAQLNIITTAPTVTTAPNIENSPIPTVTSVVYEVKFSDIKPDNKAYNALGWMLQRDIVKGYSDNSFRPDVPVTRADFSSILIKAFKLVSPVAKLAFKDLSANDANYEIFNTAKDYLPFQRKADGDYFTPLNNATREDIAVALVKTLSLDKEIPDLNLLKQFSDSKDISSDKVNFVAIAIKNKIFGDISKLKVFNPKGEISRGEITVLVYDLIKNK